jgi:hypothetical protein
MNSFQLEIKILSVKILKAPVYIYSCGFKNSFIIFERQIWSPDELQPRNIILFLTTFDK